MIEQIHHEQFIRHDESETESMGDQADIGKAIQGVHDRLDTLRSINEANILLPGGPQEHNPQLVKEAYVVLGSIETEVEHSERSLNSNTSVWKVQQMEL